MELIFEVIQEEDGGFVAECLSEDIFTQADTWEELRYNVQEAVTAYFFDKPLPSSIRLHLVKDEILAVSGNYPVILVALILLNFLKKI